MPDSRLIRPAQPIWPSAGNVSSSQNEKVVIWPVMNRTPVTTRSAAHGLLDRAEMAAEAPHEMHERPGEEPGDQERHAEAERIDREQHRPARHRLLGAGDAEDRRQHRPDARRPAEGEGQAHEIGADRPGRMVATSMRAWRWRSAILKTPRKCSPMTMMIDAADDGERRRDSCRRAGRSPRPSRRARRRPSRSRDEGERRQRSPSAARRPRRPRRSTGRG